MQLDDKKFEEIVRKDNDIGSILKLLGDILCAEESVDPDDSNAALNMITLDEAHFKGSVDVARGKAFNLANKPKLEHRNTVVRDVKRGLSMRGIEINSDSDSSVSSGYEHEELRHERRDAHGAAAKDALPTRKHRQTAEQRQTENDKETEPRSAGKFTAAASTARVMSSASNKDARKRSSSRGSRRASDDMDAASSVSSKDEGKKSSLSGKFKSAAVAVASTSRFRKASKDVETASVSSKDARKCRPSRRRNSDGLRCSFSGRGTDGDRSQSSGGSPMGKTRRKASGIPRSQSTMAEVSLEQYTRSKSVGERTRTRSSPGEAGSGRRRVRKGSF